MATSPDLRQGRVRTYELLELLIDDYEQAMNLLMANQESQFLRRTAVRTTMVFVEGVLQILKYELKRVFRLQETEYKLSEKERWIVYEEKTMENGEVIPAFVPFDQNFLKVFKLANKILAESTSPIIFSQENKKIVTSAQKTRNKLTHPRTFYDVQIQDSEITCMLELFDLTRDTFIKVMTNQKSIDELAAHGISQNDINKAITDLV